MLQNTKLNKGFTLVELLIVIVVIAILAAISIVAYNGIQDRGKASAGQTLASQVAKKAEAYNTIQSSYPTSVTAFNATTAPDEANLDDTTKVTPYATTGAGVHTNVDNYDDGKVIYRGTANGGCVYWWDYPNDVQDSIRFGTGVTC